MLYVGAYAVPSDNAWLHRLPVLTHLSFCPIHAAHSPPLLGCLALRLNRPLRFPRCLDCSTIFGTAQHRFLCRSTRFPVSLGSHCSTVSSYLTNPANFHSLVQSNQAQRATPYPYRAVLRDVVLPFYHVHCRRLAGMVCIVAQFCTALHMLCRARFPRALHCMDGIVAQNQAHAMHPARWLAGPARDYQAVR